MILEVLDDRKQKVLEIIIEDYINSAEPVGSRSVTEKHNLDASPATIRFDMADLERQGYIKKPHTSAGRIPSDKGYRFFIDNIMEVMGLSAREAGFISDALSRTEREDWPILLADILSSLCGNISIVISPDRHNNIYVSGISRMLRQPEFNPPTGGAGRTCEIIETIERHKIIINILSEYLEELEKEKEALSIHIGSENKIKPLKQCSVAATPYKEKGILGIIGPTRIDYNKVSSVLRHIANILEEQDL